MNANHQMQKPTTSPTYVDRLDLNEGPVEMNKEPLNRKFSGKLNPTTADDARKKRELYEQLRRDIAHTDSDIRDSERTLPDNAVARLILWVQRWVLRNQVRFEQRAREDVRKTYE